jgi:hypothetical protein
MTAESLTSGRDTTADARATALSAPSLNNQLFSHTPFRHAMLTACFSAATGEYLLRWLETDAPWVAKRTDFYEQFEFSCWDSVSPAAAYLTSTLVLDQVRDAMTGMFGVSFDDEVSIVCHKLVHGQHIGIHNDYLDDRDETHRLTIQVNRGLADADGGVLMLFNSDDAADIHRLLRPEHLSALAFEISPQSFHAVSQIHSGERYTIIYSLRAVR